MDYQLIAKQIVEAVGGEKNIQSVVHCSTRLRFTLKKTEQAKDHQVRNIDGVMSLVKSGGQYQLVIGNDVNKVYDAIVSNYHINSENDSSNKEQDQNIINRILSTITGSIAPVVPILAGAGMGKVLLMILSMIGALDKSSQTYYILNFIFDTGFYFMPAFIGFSAAKIFGSNPYLGALVVLTMLHPKWVALLDAKEAVSFIGIPVSLVKYSGQLIPALVTVWVMSYIEKIVYKYTPDIVKVFMSPLLVILISAPLAIVIIGPASYALAQFVADTVLWIQQNLGLIAIPLLSAIYPWLVSIGMHKALSPISIMLVEQIGFDPVTRVIALTSNMSQAAASLAVSIKSKNQELKQLAFSSSLTAFLGGITEPALYGVNLKLRTPMYGAMIGAAAGGLYAGIVQLKAFVYVTPGLLSLPMWISDVHGNYLIHAVITLIISSVVTFIATYLIGFEDLVSDEKKTK